MVATICSILAIMHHRIVLFCSDNFLWSLRLCAYEVFSSWCVHACNARRPRICVDPTHHNASSHQLRAQICARWAGGAHDVCCKHAGMRLSKDLSLTYWMFWSPCCMHMFLFTNALHTHLIRGTLCFVLKRISIFLEYDSTFLQQPPLSLQSCATVPPVLDVPRRRGTATAYATMSILYLLISIFTNYCYKCWPIFTK